MGVGLRLGGGPSSNREGNRGETHWADGLLLLLRRAKFSGLMSWSRINHAKARMKPIMPTLYRLFEWLLLCIIN